MNLLWSMALLSAGAVVLGPASAGAQVTVRAPFVRVQVGGPGVYVRAPFVRVYVPRSEPYGPVFIAPAPRPMDIMPPADAPKSEPNPQPDDPDDLAPPKPIKAGKAPTLAEFAKAFQPRAGSYEVVIHNPVTKEATNVRFTLPEGKPSRVIVSARQIEFQYGPRQFVRIELDRDGALVTWR